MQREHTKLIRGRTKHFVAMVDRIPPLGSCDATGIIQGRQRNRERSVCSSSSLPEHQKKQTVRPSQLRSIARSSGGERTLWTLKGSFYWRGIGPQRFVGGGGWRDALSRRNQLVKPAGPGQVVAVSAEPGISTFGSHQKPYVRRSDYRGDKHGPERPGEPKTLPRRSVSQTEYLIAPCTGASRSA